MTKLIIFVVIAIVLQIIASYKKSQDEARRRAMQAGLPPRRPTTHAPPARADEEEEDEEPDFDEDEPEILVAPGLPPALAPVPRVAPARTHHAVARRDHVAPTHVLVHSATPLPPPPRRSAIRLDRRRLRAAIVFSEVIGRPVALRDP